MQTLSYSKLKPSYVVQFYSSSGPVVEGRIIGKHNGSKTLTILGIHDGSTYEEVPYSQVIGRVDPDPFDQIHPMLAKDVAKYKTLNKDDLLADDEWWLEEKYDGERQILTVFNGPIMVPDAEAIIQTERWDRATTRVVGKNTGVLAENTGKLGHIFRDLRESLPEDRTTVFDGELMHHEGFRTLRSIMGSDDDKALVKQQENGKVFAVLFDVLWFNGEDLRNEPFWRRRAILSDWYLNNCFSPHVALSIVAKNEDEKRELLDNVFVQGGEGGMLKYVEGTYTDTTIPKRRSADLLKIKPFVEEDVIIYGFEMGKGEYNQHKYGAINFCQIVRDEDLTPEMQKNIVDTAEDYVLVHMGSCSGITDEQEEEFRTDPEKFIGMTMEVKYQSRWPDTGLMRHPNFMRLRSDKPAEDCIFVPGE